MTEPSTAVSILKGLASIPEPIVKSAVAFVESLLGEPLKVAGSAVADQVEMWKWQNRVRIAVRAKEIMEEEKVAARVVPPAFLLPLVEGAGYSDDPVLQDMWARLLVSGVTDDARQQPILIRVLRDLSPHDARLFLDVCRRAVRWGLVGPIDAGSKPFWGDNAPSDPREIILAAVGLIEWGSGFVDAEEIGHTRGPLVAVPSSLGWLLKEAVIPKFRETA